MTIVYFAGSRWDDVPGTDRQLMTHVARHVDVMWVDPPLPLRAKRRGAPARAGATGSHLETVATGVRRLCVLAPPGVTRAGIRSVAWSRIHRKVRQLVRSQGLQVAAVVVATPLVAFPEGIDGHRIYYVTDHWISGARLMGLSPRYVARVQARNVAAAGTVAAVSPTLAAQLTTGHGCVAHVVPNGCLVPAPGTAPVPPGPESFAPVAGLVGQLNERLDLSMLEAVAATGCAVSIVGPRADHDATFGRRLDELLARPNVHWHGAQSATAVQSLLGSWGVGLTPYVDNEFNRASFPLKTLEYLAAGLPCVSTDLPAVAWLATDLVDVASDPRTFARLVQLRLLPPADGEQRVRRQQFARQHSWDARARQFLDLLPSHATPSGIPSAPDPLPTREAT